MDNWNKLAQTALNIFLAGVQAADPEIAVKKYLTRQDRQLSIRLSKGEKRSKNWSKVHLIAFGKAACAMATAAQEILTSEPNLMGEPGLVVTNYQNFKDVPKCEVLGAQHPTPDFNGYQAAQKIAQRAQAAQEGELVLVLISGGGSALIPYPPESISLEDKITTTKLLLGCGANINQINGVRKHLSQLKGGGLTRFAAPADLQALILSDVIGDEVSAIASGPTVPDSTTYEDATQVLKPVWEQVPLKVRQHLEAGKRGEIPETPKEGDPIFANSNYTIIGSNRISINALIEEAKKQGFTPCLYKDELTGEASQVAQDLVEFALQQERKTSLAILAGGETTVTLNENPGLGGRNQEMSLAFAIAAKQKDLTGNWVFLSGGSDGRDGPTDAAGGIVDPTILGKIAEAQNYLHNHDAYHALQKADALLQIGATGTNVADLQVLLLSPSSEQ
jgi:hydroxypyruvate reductase